MLSHFRLRILQLLLPNVSLVLTLGLTPAGVAFADDPYEQRYAEWKQHPSGEYYYCKYQFRSAPGSPVKTQYVVWYPKGHRKKYLYYYNPDSKVYWCRARNHYHELFVENKHVWNVLSPENRQPRLARIESWPDAATVPPVPGAEADSKMLPPPTAPDPATLASAP